MRLENKVIIVTASTRGIGWEIVQACAREGGIVYMAVRDQQRGGELAQAMTSKGMWVKSVYMDARKEETMAAMAELVATEEGRIDVLVNNFGIGDPERDRDLEHTSFDDFMRIVRSNLASVYLTSQAVIEPMRASGGGSIINISSVGGRYPDLARVGYGVSKAAVNFLTLPKPMPSKITFPLNTAASSCATPLSDAWARPKKSQQQLSILPVTNLTIQPDN